MPKVRPAKPNEVVRFLQRLGFEHIRQSGRHPSLYRITVRSNQIVGVPRIRCERLVVAAAQGKGLPENGELWDNGY